ncbi:hypothetical protein Q5752_004791 [Cryptotrichosporon argae]
MFDSRRAASLDLPSAAPMSALVAQWATTVGQAFSGALGPGLVQSVPLSDAHPFFQPLRQALQSTSAADQSASAISGYLPAPPDARDGLAAFVAALCAYLRGSDARDPVEAAYDDFQHLVAAHTEANKLYATTAPDGGYAYPFLNSLILGLARALVRLSAHAASLSPHPIRDPRSPRQIRDTTRQAIERSLQVASSPMTEAEWAAEVGRSASVADALWPLANVLWRIYAQRKLHTQATELIKSLSSLSPAEDKRLAARAHAVAQTAVAESYYWRGRLGVVLLDPRNAKYWLDKAWAFCPPGAAAQRRSILIKLVPVNLLLGRLPFSRTLETHALSPFVPLLAAFRAGNVPAWRRALHDARGWLRARGVWLILYERAEVLVWRNLFRAALKAYYAADPAAPANRCPTWVFHAAAVAAFRGSGEAEDGALALEDVVSVLSSLIDQSLVLGNLSYSQQVLVMRSAPDGMGGFPAVARVVPRRVEAVA